MLRRTWL